jgi:Co/Zn/Cd efflux system component
MSITIILILSITGAALIFFLAWYAIKERKRIKETGVSVEGLVLNVENEYNAETSRATHILHIQYTTAEGEVIKGTYRDIFYPSTYKESDTLTIVYDVKNANKFILANMRKK